MYACTCATKLTYHTSQNYLPLLCFLKLISTRHLLLNLGRRNKEAEMTSLPSSLLPIESHYIAEVTKFVCSLLKPITNLIHNENETFQITHVERLKSAQQHVLLLSVTLPRLMFKSDDDNYSTRRDVLHSLYKAVKDGNGKIILRIWENGARWWNLNLKRLFHHNNVDTFNCDSVTLCNDLANAEVPGYKVAKRAIEYYNNRCKEKISWVETNLYIPNVIYFHESGSILTSSLSNRLHSPWALFSYVGEDSNYTNRNDRNSCRKYKICDDFIHNMVKNRHEFGFDEPHPRHGRVNTDQALDYALVVLDTIIFPVHTAFYDCYFRNSLNNNNESETQMGPINEHPLLQQDGNNLVMINYIDIEKESNYSSNKNLCQSKGCQYLDMVKMYQNIVSYLNEEVSDSQEFKLPLEHKKLNKDRKSHQVNALLRTLDQCISSLLLEFTQLDVTMKYKLPAVLCHLDLQPQNMILYHKNTISTDNGVLPNILSVLDWEESCYADPRFELLLLCRKVVATREQADTLWNIYEQVIQERFEDFSMTYRVKDSILGPIDPWLKLKTVL